MDHILFEEDQKKIEKAIIEYPLGSYQIGEIARLSALLYERGIDVQALLLLKCKQYELKDIE